MTTQDLTSRCKHRYDDGEKETRVAKDLIKSLVSDSDSDRGRSSSSKKPREGDKCEAEYKTTGKFYPGLVKRQHSDGTYEILFDDGDKQSHVDAKRIKVKSSGRSRSRSRSQSRSPSRSRLQEGDKVEADYRGRGKFYPGKITRDRGDDTYDISYDDGERETRVAKRLIKSKKSGSSSSDKISKGDKVEARYRGREKYYPGKITRDRGDGTYDISYDNGERKTRVEERLIKKKRSSSRNRSRSGSPSRSSMRVGTRVEAKYRGKSKSYPGKISRVRANGTFDVACATRCFLRCLRLPGRSPLHAIDATHACIITPRERASLWFRDDLFTRRRRRRERDTGRGAPHHGAWRRGQRLRLRFIR